MMNGLDQYRQYFAGLTAAYTEVDCTFVFGGSERALRVLAEGSQDILVWLVWPEAEKRADGNVRFTADLLFLIPAENEEAAEDAALLQALTIANDFDEQLRADSENGLHMYAPNTSFSPRHRVTGDNLVGYVLEADLTLGCGPCHDPAKFGQS